MVQYAIVRYTKEIVGYEDGEREAKITARVLAKLDCDDCDAWYSIEPVHVY